MRYKSTNGELAGILAGLQKVTEKDISISPKVSYAIIKNKQTLETALKPFDETRDGIIKKYSNGKPSVEAKDDPEAFKQIAYEIGEVAREEIEVDIREVPLSAFGDSAPLDMMMALGFMIKDDGENSRKGD